MLSFVAGVVVGLFQDDSSAVVGGIDYDARPSDYQQRQHQQQQAVAASQFYRGAGTQYITAPAPSISSSSSPSFNPADSSTTTVQPHQQTPGGYPYAGYEMFDPRWMMLPASYARATGRPPGAPDYPPAYGGGTAAGPGPGRLVGNAAPTPARRATVEYRVVQPDTVTTHHSAAASAVQPGVYPSMDYLNFAAAALPFQTAAAGVYGKQNY